MKSIIADLYLRERKEREIKAFSSYAICLISLGVLIFINSTYPLKKEGKLIRIFGSGLCTLVLFYPIVTIKRLLDDDENIFITREGRLEFHERATRQLVEYELNPPESKSSNLSPLPGQTVPVESVSSQLVQEEVKSITPVKELVEIPNSDSRKKKLWEDLNQPEYQILIKLLEAKPLLVCGPQGSGKTVFCGYLALLRRLFMNHVVEVNDPHAHLNDWPKGFNIYGHKLNYSAIGKRLSCYYERIKNPSKEKQTTIWDELTNYQERVNKDLAEGFLKSLLSDCRKPPEYPIIIAHGETLTALGGGKGGVSKMSEEGLLKVRLQVNHTEFGVPFPAMRGIVIGLSRDDQGDAIPIPITIENWMTPQYLLSVFPELNNSSIANENIEMPKHDNNPNHREQYAQLKPSAIIKKSDDRVNAEILKDFVLSRDITTVSECLKVIPSFTPKIVLFLFEKWDNEGIGSVESDFENVEKSKFLSNNSSRKNQDSQYLDKTQSTSTNTSTECFGDISSLSDSLPDEIDENTCPCGGEYRRNGFSLSGKLRLRCKECGRSKTVDNPDNNPNLNIFPMI